VDLLVLVVLAVLEDPPAALQVLEVPAASVVLDPLVVQLALEDLEALLAKLEAQQASAVLAALVEKVVPLANLEDPDTLTAPLVLEDPQAARLGSAVPVALEDLEVLLVRLEALAVLVAPLV
jgi:hypothetical protein